MSAFEQLGIQSWLAKQCSYMALTTPTPIQQKTIPAILAGRHVVGGAATGSGKTAAFALPLLQILSEDMYGVFALVLTPSRELAYQILDQFIALGAPLRVRTMLVIGGVKHDDQLDAIKARPHIVVATPGRLKHLLTTFSAEVARAFAKLRFLVMDEADRLTEGDMQTDVRAVLDMIKPTPLRRTLFFTATLHPRLTRLNTTSAAVISNARDRDGESILPLVGISREEDVLVVALANTASMVGPAALSSCVQSSGSSDRVSNTKDISRKTIDNDADNDHDDNDSDDDDGDGNQPSPSSCLRSGGEVAEHAHDDHSSRISFPEGLQQKYIFIPNIVKLPNLVAALRAQGKDQRTIVFVNSCMRAELVRLTLQLLGFPVCSLDSLLTQQTRLDNLALFKLGIARVLVCTDIASRGLDIPAVGLVVHYDVPKNAASYVHRVGRTARAGLAGLSVAIVTEYDVELVQRIEKRTKVKLESWKEKALREANVLKVLDEVSAAKIQAKQQVDERFGNRVSTLKEHAAERKAQKQVEYQERQRQAQETRRKRIAAAAAAAAERGDTSDGKNSTWIESDRSGRRGAERSSTVSPVVATKGTVQASQKRARSATSENDTTANQQQSSKKKPRSATPASRETKSAKKGKSS